MARTVRRAALAMSGTPCGRLRRTVATRPARRPLAAGAGRGYHPGSDTLPPRAPEECMRYYRSVVPAILLLAFTAVGCRKTTVGVPADPGRAAAPSPVYRADLSGAWARVGPKSLADDPTK